MKIEEAGEEDAADILDLQRLAYQSEARLYDDYLIPPLTQTLDEMKGDIDELFELFTGHLSGKNLYLYEKSGYREFRRERVSVNLELIYLEKRTR